MKTLFNPFFSRSTPSDRQSEEKAPSRQHISYCLRNSDKAAQPTDVQRGASKPPHDGPQTLQTQQLSGSGAISSRHVNDDTGLLGRLMRRGSFYRKIGEPATVPTRPSTSGGPRNRHNLAETPPPSSSASAARAMGAAPAGQLTTVPDEAYGEGVDHASPSCSQAAPPRARRQKPEDPSTAAASTVPRTHRHSSIFQKSGVLRREQPGMTADMVSSAKDDASPHTHPKLRPKSTFRDRFWSASSANDFGENQTAPKTGEARDAPAAPKHAAYVPRHAAADFSRTTLGQDHTRRHSASWGGSKSSERAPTPVNLTGKSPTARDEPQQENYTHRAPSAGEQENPFADNNEADADRVSERESLRHQRRSAPPAMDRNSVAESAAGADEWPPSDYERFLASARADEKTKHAQAVRRSWRNSDIARRDSAYCSGKKGGAGSSGEESNGMSGGRRDAAAQWSVEAKRQSRVAQRIVEYIKPPREGMARTGSFREL